MFVAVYSSLDCLKIYTYILWYLRMLVIMHAMSEGIQAGSEYTKASSRNMEKDQLSPRHIWSLENVSPTANWIFIKESPNVKYTTHLDTAVRAQLEAFFFRVADPLCVYDTTYLLVYDSLKI